MKATIKKQFLSKLMKNAWNLYKETKCTFSHALKSAWAQTKKYFDSIALKDKLKSGIVKFSFEKDGIKYNYTGTLNLAFIPVNEQSFYKETSQTRFFDITAKKWKHISRMVNKFYI